MSWKDCIIDRTQEDIEYARQNRNDVENLRGARNASDLNRVNENIEYLSQQFELYGYGILITTKQDWIVTDIPRVNDIRQILDDIDMLRTMYFVQSTTPDTPAVPINTFFKMNSVEEILHDMYLLLSGMINNFIYCGEIESGEDI